VQTIFPGLLCCGHAYFQLDARISVAWPSLLLIESKIYQIMMVLSYSVAGKMKPIFCGNFEYDARPSDLERLFSRYGKVERVDMKSGKISRPSCIGNLFIYIWCEKRFALFLSLSLFLSFFFCWISTKEVFGLLCSSAFSQESNKKFSKEKCSVSEWGSWGLW
jgi:hypothetical protein